MQALRQLTMTATRGALVMLLALLVAPLAEANPRIEHWVTDNGARVYFVAAPEIPMLDVRVVFAAGSARDGEHAGLARLTNELLTEGAAERDADAFKRALGATGARLSNGALRDMGYVELRTLVDATYAEPALALLEDALAQPRFDADALERAKARTLIALKHKEQSPDAIVEEAFYANLYPDHPYGTPTEGTPESVPGLTRELVADFHQQYYVAQNAVIAIVGAVDRARAEAIAAELAGALPSGERAPPLPAVPAGKAHEERIEFPSIQSHVRVGLPGMTRDDPDYFPLLVGNHALGGNSLVSILFREIRGKRGLSYSAYSYFAPMAQAGPFVAALQTDRTQEEEAMRVLRETIADFVTNGPPAEDLAAAKQNLVGGFPLRIDSNDKITDYIAMIGFYDLPLDYLESFPEKVAAVTAEQVRDAFARRVSLDRLVTVIVGRSEPPTDG
ncbi:MAG: pitrilysin family protein [Gammaproteobacteria bacterium]